MSILFMLDAHSHLINKIGLAFRQQVLSNSTLGAGIIAANPYSSEHNLVSPTCDGSHDLPQVPLKARIQVL